MDKQLKYIVNAVLLPQLIYLTTTYVPDQKNIEEWQARIRSTCWHNLNLPRTFITSAIELSFGIKIGNLQDRIERKIIDEITIGVENQLLYGTIFKIRVQQLQNRV